MKGRFVLVGVVMVVSLLAMAAALTMAQGPGPEPQAAVGTAFTYQGRLKRTGQDIAGPCDMAFRLYDDGSAGSQVGGAVSTTVAITDGLFTVALDFGGAAFAGDARWLGIRVRCPGDAAYTDLGRQRLTAAPYALYAPTSGSAAALQGRTVASTAPAPGQVLKWSGSQWAPAADSGAAYRNLVVVARSGGDYSSIQAAIGSIGDASATNPYLVWVAPGVYSETVAMKPFVHVQGAGQAATVITSSQSTGATPSQATIVLTRETSLRDLTVGNGATVAAYKVSLLATDGTTGTVVAGVMAQTRGGGSVSFGIYLRGNSTSVVLHEVTALAQDGTNNYGLYVGAGAAASLRGGSFAARGVANARAIHVADSGTSLQAEHVTAWAEDASGENSGLDISLNPDVSLHGGSFTGRGGATARGIYNHNGGYLEAEDVVVVGENATGTNSGLDNYSGARATLRGGSYTARHGSYTRGVRNCFLSAYLRAESVTVRAEDASSSNYGLQNCDSGDAAFRGGSLTAHGGTSSVGIYNEDLNTRLVAEGVSIVGEGGSSSEYALYDIDDAVADVTHSMLTGADKAVWLLGGTVSVAHSRLVGGAVSAGVTCIAVSRGAAFNASGCP